MTLRRTLSFILFLAMITSLSLVTYANNGKNSSVVELQTENGSEKNYSAEATQKQEELTKEYFETAIDEPNDKYSSLMSIKNHIDITHECFNGHAEYDETEYTFEKILYDSIKREIVSGIENMVKHSEK